MNLNIILGLIKKSNEYIYEVLQIARWMFTSPFSIFQMQLVLAIFASRGIIHDFLKAIKHGYYMMHLKWEVPMHSYFSYFVTLIPTVITILALFSPFHAGRCLYQVPSDLAVRLFDIKRISEEPSWYIERNLTSYNYEIHSNK